MFWIIISILLFFVVLFEGWIIVRNARIMLTHQTNLQEAIDILEQTFTTFEEISQKDLFFDSPEVMALLHEVAKGRDAIAYVIDSLTSAETTEEDLETIMGNLSDQQNYLDKLSVKLSLTNQQYADEALKKIAIIRQEITGISQMLDPEEESSNGKNNVYQSQKKGPRGERPKR